MSSDTVALAGFDALLLVDVQRDFLPGGSLAVPDGDAVVPVLCRYIDLFRRHRLPVVATRDWHTPDHCSFREQGGIWPPHCVAGSAGAGFADELDIGENTLIISKATESGQDAYSGFHNTDLHAQLQAMHTHRLFIGGLATDYCVLRTVLDALDLGYEVFLLADAVRAVDIEPGDGDKAVADMEARGAIPIRFGRIA